MSGSTHLEGRGPRRRGGGVMALVALAVLVLFVAAVWYAYDRGVRTGGTLSPPLVRADVGPTKVRPEDPGGLEVPHQDKLVYETLSGEPRAERVERLLPPPEEPMAKPTSLASAPEPAGTEKAVPVQPVTSRPEPVPPPTSGLAPPSTPPAAVAPPPPLITAEPARPAAVPAPAAPKVATAPATPPQEPAPRSAGGSFRVQLASYREPDAATKGWARLAKANGDLLGGLSPSVVRADLGSDKGVFYRLQAGPFPDRAAANNLCAKLKSKNVGCIVVRP